MAQDLMFVPLAAAFCQGLLILSIFVLLAIALRGNLELVFRQGRRLSLFVFLLFALIYATFTFVDLFATDVGFCEASIGISTFSDQVARTAILGLLVWSFGHRSLLEQNIWRAVIALRLVVSSIYVAFTRAELALTCQAKAQDLGLPIALLVVDAGILLGLLVRISMLGHWQTWRESADRATFKFCGVSVAFVVWDALSAPMILRKPALTILPTIGLLMLIAFLCLYPTTFLEPKEAAPDVERKPPLEIVTPKPTPLSPRLGSPYTLPRRRELPLRVVNPSKVSSSRSSVRWDTQTASIIGVWTGTEIFSPEPPKPPAKENRHSYRSYSKASLNTSHTSLNVPEATIFEAHSPLSQMSSVESQANSQRFNAVRSTLSTLFPGDPERHRQSSHPVNRASIAPLPVYKALESKPDEAFLQCDSKGCRISVETFNVQIGQVSIGNQIKEIPGLGVQVVDVAIDPEEKKALTPAPLAPKRQPSEASLKSNATHVSRKPVPSTPGTPVLRESLLVDVPEVPSMRESLDGKVAKATSVKRIQARDIKPKRARTLRPRKTASIPSFKVLPVAIKEEERKRPWHYRIGDSVPTFSRRKTARLSAQSIAPPPIPLRSAKRDRTVLQKRNRSPRTLVRDVQLSLSKYQEPQASPKAESDGDKLIFCEAQLAEAEDWPWIPALALTEQGEDTVSRRSSMALPSSLPKPSRSVSTARIAAAPVEGVPFEFLTLKLGSPLKG